MGQAHLHNKVRYTTASLNRNSSAKAPRHSQPNKRFRLCQWHLHNNNNNVGSITLKIFRIVKWETKAKTTQTAHKIFNWPLEDKEIVMKRLLRHHCKINIDNEYKLIERVRWYSNHKYSYILQPCYIIYYKS